ncbi:MAG: hypothetical protein K6G03_00545 [Lachnospiraceae bacterium]|nr:hypothetical protein [Lachnospiraceae bacterium]
MIEKKTSELNSILKNTHPKDFEKYLFENKDSLLESPDAFYSYIKDLIKRNGLTQQDTFLAADIPERYGYKLLTGEKHTRQRDVILRICYGAELSLDETQLALEKYGMPQLYSKIPRDALLMTVFNKRPGSVIDVNRLLTKNNLAPLKTSGVQE